jgi:hypothetical protein
LWFKFASVSPRPIPKEFGDLSKFKNFEEWWRHPDYGFELFCEPVKPKSLVPVTAIDELHKDLLYLKINLNEEPQKLKRLFDSALKRHQKKELPPLVSQARFQPSLSEKNMKFYAWENYLEIWKLREQGLSRQEAFEAHYKRKWEKDDLDALRNVSRACQRVNEIFKSIENGTFP